MSKDPAVLFYPSDFLTGTFLMDYEQKGKYITLLCLQHQVGRMSKVDMDKVLNGDEYVLSKFKQDEDGKYYNERMDEEYNKRKAYSESRRNNKKGVNQHTKKRSYDQVMTLHMENENEDVDVIKVKKEIKKEKYAEFVKMTEVEYIKLTNKFGIEFTQACIDTLDNYKGAKGKIYKSDYRAILSWVVDKVKEKKPSGEVYHKPKSLTNQGIL